MSNAREQPTLCAPETSLKTLTALLAIATSLSGAAHADQPATLKLQAAVPASSSLFEAFRHFAERTDKLSGGTLRIETLAAGQVVPVFELLDATHKRVVDGAATWAGYWQGKNKAAVLFTGGPGGPFGMDHLDYLGWMYAGGGWELYQQFYREVLKLNVFPIPLNPVGPQAFGWFKRPIRNLADFKGLKCRQAGVAAEVFQRMGMTTVNMPGGDILSAAQRGAIDCAEWVGGIEDLRFGFHTVWKYHYTPGIHESTSVAELILNGDAWASLTPTQREVVRSAANETYVLWWGRWQRQNAEAMRELRERHAVHVLRTPPDILVRFLQVWDEMAREEGMKNAFFKRVHESQYAYAALVVPEKRLMFPPYSFAANHYFPTEKGK